jgi:hypothetical protein
MGQHEDTTSANPSQKIGRFPPRPCLRKGCGRVFVPTHWKQRYCHTPDCERELHRWQAAKRQRRRRRDPEIRRQHAEQERQRRRRRREELRCRLAATSPRSSAPNLTPSSDTPSSDTPSSDTPSSDTPSSDTPSSDTPSSDAPSSDAPSSDAPRAWSRNRRHPENFCDRPGCYEPVRPCCRARARYCGKECSKAMGRVRDRERKCKWRTNKRATRRRRGKHASRQRDRRQIPDNAAAKQSTKTATDRRTCPESVRGYRRPAGAVLSCHETHQEVPEHDRETSLGRGPRAPPSE